MELTPFRIDVPQGDLDDLRDRLAHQRDAALANRDGRNIVHWTGFDRGGHFAAVEVPDLLVGDVRDFFRAPR
jgi:hypothetical protein